MAAWVCMATCKVLKFPAQPARARPEKTQLCVYGGGSPGQAAARVKRQLTCLTCDAWVDKHGALGYPCCPWNFYRFAGQGTWEMGWD